MSSADSVSPPSPRRINVAISDQMLAAIDLVIESERVTLTEAVRRLVTYGDFVYRAIKEREAEIRMVEPDGKESVVQLL